MEPRQLLAHVGGSPFDPPAATSSMFVIDTGPGLDTGPVGRSEGPLLIDLTIDRWIGDRDSLLKYGLIPPTVTLRMPAYDVDVKGYPPEPWTPPEVDRVTFIDSKGGELRLGNLDGDDNIWQMNSFTIPTELLDFGTFDGEKYVPGKNQIRVDIDVDSPPGVDNWVTEIDWVAFEIPAPDPVIFVHGILSAPKTWGEAYRAIQNEYGVPTAFADLGYLDNIKNNANKIDQLYQDMFGRWTTATYDQASRPLKVDLVGHSKGGLDSRELTSRVAYVDQVIQIGTPNGGSPLANAVQLGIFRIPKVGLAVGLIGALVAPAGYQLTTLYMAAYNYAGAGWNPSVSYSAIAGNYKFGSFIEDAALSLFYSGDSDLVVPVWSVNSFAGLSSFVVFPSRDSDHQAMHFDLSGGAQTASPGIANQYVIPALLGRSPGSRSVPLRTRAMPAMAMATASPPPPSPAEFGDVGQGETQTKTILIDDASGRTVFNLYYAEDDLDMVLVSPSGRVFDGSTLTPGGGVSYFKDESDPSNKRIGYLLDPGAEVGAWTVRIRGTKVDNGSGRAFYMTLAQQETSQIEFSVALDASSHTVGQPVLVTATATKNGSPILGASVEANLRIDESTTLTISLRDDGLGGDLIAGDGVYSGVLSGAIPAGAYLVSVRGQGDASTPFDREDAALLVVGSRGAALSPSSFDNRGVDEDGDGLFDSLLVSFDAPATVAGRYVVVAELVDSSGRVIQSLSKSMNLAVGSNVVDFAFDGRKIFEAGVDGPYVVRSVSLQEDVDGILVPVGDPIGPFDSNAYRANEFAHDPARFTGGGTARGVDSDDNGLWDQLVVTLDLLTDRAGSYRWSGELIGADGRVAARANGSGWLEAGAGSITFVFNGRTIGDNDVSGPYTIRNIVMLGPGVSTLTDSTFATPSYPLTQFESDRPIIEPMADQTAAAGQTLNLTIRATSPRATGPITFSLVETPEGASIDPATGLITWTPSSSQRPGAYRFKVKATDGGSPPLDGFGEFLVSVVQANRPPAFAPIPTRQVEEGATIQFRVTATDADAPASTLTYALLPGAPAGVSIDPATGLITWTPTSPGEHHIGVRVFDSGTPSLSADAVAIVIVLKRPTTTPPSPTPEPPVVPIAPDPLSFAPVDLGRWTLIQELYQGNLGRPPEERELVAWLERLNTGESPSRLAESLYATDEARAYRLSRRPLVGPSRMILLRAARRASNATAVSTFYRDLLGRRPDAPGFSAWVHRMNQGSPPARVALSIQRSPEGLAARRSGIARAGLGQTLQNAFRNRILVTRGSEPFPRGPLATRPVWLAAGRFR